MKRIPVRHILQLQKIPPNPVWMTHYFKVIFVTYFNVLLESNWRKSFPVEDPIGLDSLGDGTDESVPISSARTRVHNQEQDSDKILPDDVLFPHSSVSSNDFSDENNQLLKDVTAAVDICRCNPCRCDPLLNDCSVSCNPVLDGDVPNNFPNSNGCGCGCGKKKDGNTASQPRNSCCSQTSESENRSHVSCGCSCNSSEAEVGQIKMSLPCHSQDMITCSSDPDPCCIVVCLKHLKQQYLMDRPNCCV